MRAQFKSSLANLPLNLRFPEFARAAGKPEDEDYETLWDRVIRMCDEYDLKLREHCPA